MQLAEQEHAHPLRSRAEALPLLDGAPPLLLITTRAIVPAKVGEAVAGNIHDGLDPCQMAHGFCLVGSEELRPPVRVRASRRRAQVDVFCQEIAEPPPTVDNVEPVLPVRQEPLLIEVPAELGDAVSDVLGDLGLRKRIEEGFEGDRDEADASLIVLRADFLDLAEASGGE